MRQEKEKEWTYSSAQNCYFYANFNQSPKVICKGERLAHLETGSYFSWRGSTIDNWHGYQFKHFGEALEWVQAAEHEGLIEWDKRGRVTTGRGDYKWSPLAAVVNTQRLRVSCSYQNCNWYMDCETDTLDNFIRQYKHHYVGEHLGNPRVDVLDSNRVL